MKLKLTVLFIAGISAAFLYPHFFPKTGEVNREVASIPANPENAVALNLDATSFVAYHYERNVKADLKDTASKTLVDLKLNGTVFVIEIAKTATTRTLLLQFSLTMGQEQTAHESHVPFLVEMNADQSIKGIKIGHTGEKIDEDDFNVLKDFTSLYAYGANRDTTGVYQFKLSHVQNEIEKSKLSYVGLNVPITFVSSKTKAEVEAGSGVWVKGGGTEQTRTESGAGAMLLTTYSYKIEKVNNARMRPPKLLANVSAFDETTLAVTSAAQVQLKTWAELKARLQAIKTLSREQRLSLFHELSKLLKTDPGAVASFRKYVESAKDEVGLMTFAIGVLATAGSESAQAALIDWYKGGYGMEHTVLNAFATANNPLDPESKAFLMQVVAARAADPDLAQNAVFALGSSLKQDGDSATQKALADYYAASQTESDKLSGLDAMGNSGDPRFLPTLNQAISSGNEAEQTTAVMATRFLPADQAAPILLAAYNSSDLGMQKASVRALAYQQPAPNAKLIQECAGAGDLTCINLSKQLGN